MQKRLLFVAFLLLAICNKIVAEDQLTISDFSLYSGVSKTVSVNLTNEDTYVGFQFDLYLPDGITVEACAGSDRLPEGTTPQMAQPADGFYRFVAAALSGNAITGNEGAVMTITLKADDAMDLGDYTALLRNVKISKADGSGPVTTELPVNITVKGPEPYAALNQDNTVLTFYYDKLKDNRAGMDIGTFNSGKERGWHASAEIITGVVFDDSFASCNSITSTDYWFSGCRNLTTITGINNLNTSNVTSMEDMFFDCRSLTSLDVTGFNTANVTSMNGMFSGCSFLTSLDVTGFDTQKVTDMRYMFNNCPSLTSLDVSRFNTQNVTDMGHMFNNCPSLTSIDVSHFNTQNVTAITAMFRGCSSLTSLDVTGFDTQKVTDMGYMFMNCPSLTTIYVGSEWSTSAVNNSENMFTGCSVLVGGAFTAYDADHVDAAYAHIDGGVDNPGYLTDIADNANVAEVLFHRSMYELTISCETQNTRIMYAVIPANSGEATTEEPDWQLYSQPITLTGDCTVQAYAIRPSGIRSITSEFTFSMSDVMTVDTPTFAWNGNQLTMNCATEDATIWYTLTGIDDPIQYQAPFDVTIDITISAWATKDQMNQSDTLTLVYPYTVWNELMSYTYWAEELLGNMASGGATHADRVPAEMVERLQTLTDEAEAMYAQRTAPEDAIMSQTEAIRQLGSEVEAILGAADEPYALLSADNSTLTFRYDWQKNFTEGAMSVSPFTYSNDRPWNDYVEGITTVVFDASFAAYSPTTTFSWFSGCGNLSTIEGMSNLKTDEVTDMSYMFNGCSSLTSLDLSSFNTQNVTNMVMMFYNCSSLTTLDLSSFNTSNVTDMRAMFGYCTSLTTLDLSSFNTERVTNLGSMFLMCYGLTTLDLSSFNTANAGDMGSAFSNCEKLTTIYVGNEWSTASVGAGSDMFTYCIALVGGAFTAYDADHTDYTYAHIDGGVDNPGYLTSIADTIAPAPVTFHRSMYELTMTSESQHARIMYAVTPANTGAESGEVEWRQYTEPVTLTEDCTVQAYALRPNSLQSTVTTYSFRMSDINTVDTPVFVWNGDELTINCATEEATIYYTITDETGGATEPIVYQQPFDVTIDCIIAAWATKEEMNNSDTLTLNYPYTAWMQLVDAMQYARSVMARVDAEQKYELVADLYADLNAMLTNAEAMYAQRTQGDMAHDQAAQIMVIARQIEDILNTPTEQVATPTFAWNGDELTISTTTEGAGIEYILWSENTYDEQGNIASVTRHIYEGPFAVVQNDTIRAFATMDGMIQSETAVLPYAYDAWKQLLEAIDYSQYVVSRCQGNTKVNQDEVAALAVRAAECHDYYNHSDRSQGRTEIEDWTAELQYYAAMLLQQLEAIEYAYDSTNGVLTVSGGTTLDEALEAAGGRKTVAENLTAIIWDNDTELADSLLTGLSNPNMLVYVKAASLAPVTITNVVVNGVAERIVLTDSIVGGNNNFYCPQEFTAHSISYTHSYTQSTQVGVCRGWETIALPFNVQYIEHEKNGALRPFAAEGDGKPFWLRQLREGIIVSADHIEANVPYLISMPNNPEYAEEFNQAGLVTFSAAETVVPVTSQQSVSAFNAMLVPNYSRISASAEVYAININQPYEGYAEGSLFVAAQRDVRPFEAYTLHNSDEVLPAPFYALAAWFSGDETGIEQIPMNVQPGDNDAAWYTLDGRRLPGRPTAKGIYLQHGRKVAIQ